MERGLFSIIAVILGLIALALGANALLDRTTFANVSATLSVAALLLALVVLKLYEIWRE